MSARHTSAPATEEQVSCLLESRFCVLAEEFGNRACYLMDVGDLVFLLTANKSYRTIIVARQLKDVNRPSGPAFLVVTLH